MQLLTTTAELREYRNALPGSVGFVPTMGALHAGHGSLAATSVAQNDHTIVSIFVNPTQFGPTEDFDQYPRTMEADAALLESMGVSAIFAPMREEVYPGDNAQISFQIARMDKVLCGASRPGHMNGVVQIVSILFNLVQPDKAYFGQKDYQQFLILHTMAQELHFPVEVIACPIIREEDGLAMSSRNRYMSPEERKQALFLSSTIREIQNNRGKWNSAAEIKEFATRRLTDFPLVRIDYVEVLSGKDLSALQSLNSKESPHIFIAAWLGKTRLIDNAPLFHTLKIS